MTFRFQLAAGCCLVLLSCDDPERPKPGAEDQPPPAARKVPRGESRSPKDDLRHSYERADALTSDVERAAALEEVAWNAADLDPELAKEAFGKLEPGSEPKLKLARHLAMRMAEENTADALEWCASLSDEKEAAAALGQVALVISVDDPVRAAALLSDSGVEGREFDVAVVQVLDRWAEKSAADATAWVVQFPAGEFREAGLKAVVSRWADADPGALFSWVSALPAGEIRSEAIAGIARTWRDQPEENREAWLHGADPRTRSEITAFRDEKGGN